jgi:hypothetical protein
MDLRWDLDKLAGVRENEKAAGHNPQSAVVSRGRIRI